MHIPIAGFALRQRPGDTELEGERIVALEKAHPLFRAPVKFGERSLLQDSGVLDSIITRLVGEHDVNVSVKGPAFLLRIKAAISASLMIASSHPDLGNAYETSQGVSRVPQRDSG